MSRFEGAIVPDGSNSKVDRDAWLRLIAATPALRPLEPTETVNPFTSEPTTIRPGVDAVRIVVAGVEVGAASWSMDEDEPAVNVSVRQSALPLVRGWAAELGGVLRSWDATGG